MAYYMITAPSMGAVSLAFVKDGAVVAANQRVLGLEAMKMLSEIRTPWAGKIEFCCRLGQVVNKGDVLAKVHKVV